ncbi:hypothetical protein [Kitasatospora sp. McL0602]|uniref:hypothetical protein n=1 Tax=Kitasatospora sp. McL0602 TaxID=3439530 RepID=UPI003F88E47D
MEGLRYETTRRAVLAGAAVAGAAVAASALLPGTASAVTAASESEGRKAPVSANGWPVEAAANHVSTVWTRPVAGTGLTVELRIGDVEAILVYLARRFHYEVEQLQVGDLAGWRELGALRADLPESNLASGTAVRIRPGAAAKGGLFASQELALREILAACEGVVRWGGDDSRVDESLFYVDAGPDDERVRRLADRLRAWDATPGAGAGAGPDRN